MERKPEKEPVLYNWWVYCENCDKVLWSAFYPSTEEMLAAEMITVRHATTEQHSVSILKKTEVQ